MSENTPSTIRRTVYFSGSVQGVGFRYTAQATASRFDVSGYVRNLADRRVELVAEGTRDEVDRFQHALADAMRGYINDVTANDDAPTGEFTSFGIAW